MTSNRDDMEVESPSSTANAVTTPIRHNAPPTISNDTPIASVKRPGTFSAISPSSPLHPPRIMTVHHPTEGQEETGSHETNDPEAWTKKKVDNIFSPVLQFLNGTGCNTSNASLSVSEEEEEGLSGCDFQQQQVHQLEPNNDMIYQNESEHEIEDADEISEEEFNPYLFIKHLPPYQPCSIGPILPHKDATTPPITLVLDLDETLVHCTVDPIPNPDLIFPVLFHGTSYQVHVKKRPYLESFLHNVAKKFEVVCFTASQRIYADELLNRIDPNKCISHRLFRDHCLPVEGNFLKDLNVMGRDLKKAVLVDNSPHAFGYQVDNGIPIESWFDDERDRELCKLEEFLETLHGEDDVRSKVREKFGLWKLVKDA